MGLDHALDAVLRVFDQRHARLARGQALVQLLEVVLGVATSLAELSGDVRQAFASPRQANQESGHLIGLKEVAALLDHLAGGALGSGGHLVVGPAGQEEVVDALILELPAPGSLRSLEERRLQDALADRLALRFGARCGRLQAVLGVKVEAALACPGVPPRQHGVYRLHGRVGQDVDALKVFDQRDAQVELVQLRPGGLERGFDVRALFRGVVSGQVAHHKEIPERGHVRVVAAPSWGDDLAAEAVALAEGLEDLALFRRQQALAHDLRPLAGEHGQLHQGIHRLKAVVAGVDRRTGQHHDVQARQGRDGGVDEAHHLRARLQGDFVQRVQQHEHLAFAHGGGKGGPGVVLGGRADAIGQGAQQRVVARTGAAHNLGHVPLQVDAEHRGVRADLSLNGPGELGLARAAPGDEQGDAGLAGAQQLDEALFAGGLVGAGGRFGGLARGGGPAVDQQFGRQVLALAHGLTLFGLERQALGCVGAAAGECAGPGRVRCGLGATAAGGEGEPRQAGQNVAGGRGAIHAATGTTVDDGKGRRQLAGFCAVAAL